MTLKIAIVVHGRFHAFDLARALLQRGHELTVFTNYPRWAAERFGLPGDKVRSFWFHGIVSRVAVWLHQKIGCPYPEAALHILFGRWAAAQIKKRHWDLVHCWSGVAEEVLRALDGTGTSTLLMRGSSHVRTQARILEDEEKRTGVRVDRPSPWIIAREEREYALAQGIRVLPHFAYKSFLEQQVPPEKVFLISSGAPVANFRPAVQIVEARCHRIISAKPLRVLYVGAVSFRKGFWDMDTIVRRLGRGRFHFRFVGPVAPEAKKLSRGLRHLAEFVPKQPQHSLPNWYAWGDIFVFPTIEDGYAQVLAQAHASALPILTTTNCQGPDIIREGESGWVLPIRDPGAFVDRLQWCDRHRKELAHMVRQIYNDFRPRDWSDVAADFDLFCRAFLNNRKDKVPLSER